jgi:hypothetical protein
MSLLTIVQEVAKQIPVAVPTVAVGSTDETAQALLAAATWTAKHLHRIHDWSILIKQYTVTTIPTVADYELPEDFDRLVGDTAWSRTDYERLQGGLSPQDWQMLKSGRIATPATVQSFRVQLFGQQGRKLVLDPIPTSALTLVCEYVSRNWCTASGGDEQSNWNADNDVAILDERLIELGTLYRELRRLGMSYDEEADEFERFLSLAIANDGGTAKTVSLLPRETGPVFIGPGNVPEGSWHQ